MKSIKNALKKLHILVLALSMALPHPAFAESIAPAIQVDQQQLEAALNEQVSENTDSENTDKEDDQNTTGDEATSEADNKPSPMLKLLELGQELSKEKREKKQQEIQAFDKLENLQFSTSQLKISIRKLKSQILRGHWNSQSKKSQGLAKLNQLTEELNNWKKQLIVQLKAIPKEASAMARVLIREYFLLAFDLVFARAFFQKALTIQPLQPLADTYSILIDEKTFFNIYPNRKLVRSDIEVTPYNNSQGEKIVALRWKNSHLFAQAVSSLNAGDQEKNYMPIVRCMLSMLLYSDLASTNLYLRTTDHNLLKKGLSNHALCKGVTHQELLRTYQREKQNPHIEKEVRSLLMRSPYFLSKVLVNNSDFLTIVINGDRVTPNQMGKNGLSSITTYYPFIYLFPSLVNEDVEGMEDFDSKDMEKILTQDEVIKVNEAIDASIAEYINDVGPQFYNLGYSSGVVEKLNEYFAIPEYISEEELKDQDLVGDLVYKSEVMFFQSEFNSQISKWSIPFYPLLQAKNHQYLLDALIEITKEAKVESLRTTIKYLLSYGEAQSYLVNHDQLINYLTEKHIRPALNLPEQQFAIRNFAGQVLKSWLNNSASYSHLSTAYEGHLNYALIPSAKKAVDIMVTLDAYDLPYDKVALKALFSDALHSLEHDVQSIISAALEAPSFETSEVIVKTGQETFSALNQASGEVPYSWGWLDVVSSWGGRKSKLEEFAKENKDKATQLQKAASWFGLGTTVDYEPDEVYGPKTIRNIFNSLAQDLDKEEMAELILKYRQILRSKVFANHRILEAPVHFSNCLKTEENEEKQTRLYEAIYCLTKAPEKTEETKDKDKKIKAPVLPKPLKTEMRKASLDRVVNEALLYTRNNVIELIQLVSHAHKPHELGLLITPFSNAIAHLLGEQSASTKLVNMDLQKSFFGSTSSNVQGSFLGALAVHRKVQNCLNRSPYNFYENGKCISDNSRNNQLNADYYAERWGKFFHASFAAVLPILGIWALKIASLKVPGMKVPGLKPLIDRTGSILTTYWLALTGLFAMDLAWITFFRYPQLHEDHQKMTRASFTEVEKWDVSILSSYEYLNLEEQYNSMVNGLKKEAMWDILWLSLPVVMPPIMNLGFFKLLRPKFFKGREKRWDKKFYDNNAKSLGENVGPNPELTAKYARKFRKKRNYFHSDFKDLGIPKETNWRISTFNKALKKARKNLKGRELAKAEEAYNRLVMEVNTQLATLADFPIAFNNAAAAIFRVLPKEALLGKGDIALSQWQSPLIIINQEMNLLNKAVKNIEGRAR